MHPRSLIFASLIGIHVTVIVFAPELIAPFVAGSIYLPLWPLKLIGMPVFGVTQSSGWAAPSLLGWAVVFCLWSAIWFVVATLLSRLFTKKAGHAEPVVRDRRVKSGAPRNLTLGTKKEKR